MKKFILKCLLIIVPFYAVIIGANYMGDPANLYNDEIIEEMSELLLNGNVIESPGDVGEGCLAETVVSKLKTTPEVAVVGSSHVMYIPFEYEDYFDYTLSGACFGDYLALIGLLDEYDKLPSRVIIGLDGWALSGDKPYNRHTSITKYSEQLESRINGLTASRRFSLLDGPTRDKLDKYKELFSLSYFQASVPFIRTYGLRRLNKFEINVCEDDTPSEVSKILPNFRRTMASDNYFAVESNDASAIGEINAKTMYGMYGFTKISDYNRTTFVNLIKYLTDKGIAVDIYLAPWYPMIYDELTSNPEYAGVLETESLAQEIAAENPLVSVRGSYNPEPLNIVKEDYADCFHLKPEEMLRTYNYEW